MKKMAKKNVASLPECCRTGLMQHAHPLLLGRLLTGLLVHFLRTFRTHTPSSPTPVGSHHALGVWGGHRGIVRGRGPRTTPGVPLLCVEHSPQRIELWWQGGLPWLVGATLQGGWGACCTIVCPLRQEGVHAALLGAVGRGGGYRMGHGGTCARRQHVHQMLEVVLEVVLEEVF